VAVVSGVVGMAVGSKWTGALFVVAALGAGYALAERNPGMGAVVMGAGAVTGLVMLISWVGKLLARTPAGAGMGLDEVAAAGQMPPTAVQAAEQIRTAV
jgi:hypothetical protein